MRKSSFSPTCPATARVIMYQMISAHDSRSPLLPILLRTTLLSVGMLSHHQHLPFLASARLSSSDWAQNLLTECASAISDSELVQAQQLLWVLNELSSPYGSHEQRLASYFMQALFCRLSGTGPRSHLSLCAAAERSNSFESMRKTMLKFQEASPWTTFGHVAANGAILEAFEGESRAHIMDLSNTFCMQWPTLLEALATRAEGAPTLRLTTVVFHETSSSISKVMEQVGARLEKFARLMGVPFQFKLVHHTDLHNLLQHEAANRGRFHCATARPPEALAINCVESLHRIPSSERHTILTMLHSLNPKILTLVEDEVELLPSDNNFSHCFAEALRFYSLFFDSLDESLPRTSSERLTLERAAARSIMHILACDELPEISQHERREKASQWSDRLHGAGFVAKGFSDDVFDDVKALLKRYKDGWGLVADSNVHRNDGIALTWKDQSVIFASAWRAA